MLSPLNGPSGTLSGPIYLVTSPTACVAMLNTMPSDSLSPSKSVSLDEIAGIGGVSRPGAPRKSSPQGDQADAAAQAQLNDILRARFDTAYGPVGLIIIPNAYVATKNRVVFGMYLGRQKSAQANYGVIKGIDVGVSVQDIPASTIRGLFNAKVNVVPANLKYFELGLGFIDLFGSLKQTFYLMTSTEILAHAKVANTFQGVRLHLGYGNGVFKQHVIGGGELLLSQRLGVVLEYDGTNFNYALRYVRDASFRAQVGVGDNNLFIAATYAFTP
jgi:hypothetical protein